jgi:SOUL heme-binding protein
MTAPVTFRRDHATDGYLVGFFIPSTYDTAKDISKPRDSSIGIVSFPKDATFAVVSFGGFAGPNDFKDHQVCTLNIHSIFSLFVLAHAHIVISVIAVFCMLSVWSNCDSLSASVVL